MANVPISNLTTTWNNSPTTFTGIKLNVTDTASSVNSLLLDLQVGGVSQFKVSKAGALSAQAGNATTPGFGVGTSGLGVYSRASVRLNFAISGTDSGVEVGPGILALASTSTVSWVSGSLPSSNIDISLTRDATGTLAQRNGVNAQTLRVYHTYTDASNYERGKIEWSSNVLRIGTEKAGTGIARALEFQTDGVTRLTISTSGLATFTSNGIFNTTTVSSTGLYFAGFGAIIRIADGVFRITNAAETNFNRLQLGGETSSFPSLKRDTVRLQARLADDSAFTNIQGKLTTESIFIAGSPVTTGYLVLYDAVGTAYKVPAVAL